MRNNFAGLKGKFGMFALDILFLVIVVFLMAVVFIVFKKVSYDLVDGMIVQNEALPDNVQEYGQSMNENSTGFWDFAFLFIFVALIIVLWISVWFIDTHPLFFVLLVVLMIIITLLSMMFSNTFETLMTNSAFSATAAEFTIIPFIMSNIVTIMIVVGFITGVLLFAKTRSVA